MGNLVRRTISHAFGYIFSFAITINIIFITIYLVFPKPQEYVVQDFEWERKIVIKKYTTVNETSWILPEDAVLDHTREEISGYEKVFDHYETRSRTVIKERLNGYNEVTIENSESIPITTTEPVYEYYYEIESYEAPIYRDEPVYSTKYYYKINKWVYSRTLLSNGTDKSPYWEKLALASNEEVDHYEESYIATFINTDGETKELNLSYDKWSSLSSGQIVTIYLNRVWK